MNPKDGEKMQQAAGNLRRQLGTDASKRFLRNLPMFRVETDIPQQFRDLLDRLSSAEHANTPWRKQ